MAADEERDDLDFGEGDEGYVPLPAFQLNRFKRTIYCVGNEEFAQQLWEALDMHDTLPKALYTFRQKLDQKLHDNYHKAA